MCWIKKKVKSLYIGKCLVIRGIWQVNEFHYTAQAQLLHHTTPRSSSDKTYSTERESQLFYSTGDQPSAYTVGLILVASNMFLQNNENVWGNPVSKKNAQKITIFTYCLHILQWPRPNLLRLNLGIQGIVVEWHKAQIALQLSTRTNTNIPFYNGPRD